MAFVSFAAAGTPPSSPSRSPNPTAKASVAPICTLTPHDPIPQTDVHPTRQVVTIDYPVVGHHRFT